MMKQLILHIGVAKTGTSMIQTNLAKFSNTLQDYGYVYPILSGADLSAQGKVTSGNGTGLAKWLNEDIPAQPYHPDWEPGELFTQQGVESNIILSSEFIMSYKEEKMFELIQIAGKYNYEVTIVVYLRSICGHALSSYAQHIKRAHYFESFEYFVENNYRNVFKPLMNKLKKISDISKIKVFNYDLEKKDLVNHFFTNVLNINDLEFEKNVINRSLSLYENEILREINKATKELPNGKRITTLISNTLIESQPNVKSMREVTAESIKILANKYAKDLDIINSLLPEKEKISIEDPSIEVIPNHSFGLSEAEKSIVSVLSAIIMLTNDKI